MKKRTTKSGSPARVPSAPRPRVYLDSTIPSTYFDERASISDIIATTRKWWDEESRFFDVWISPIVGLEIDDGEYPRKPEIQAFCRKLNVLEPNPTIDKIAQTYIENQIDAARSFSAMRRIWLTRLFMVLIFWLTWNCNHLANANKRIHLRVINDRLGFPLPLIVTPMELFREREDL